VRAPVSRDLDALLTAFGGATAGALGATFTVSGLTPRLREWLRENHGEQFPFVDRLLSSTALAQALPDLARRELVSTDKPEFSWLHPLELSPSLTIRLSGGGPHSAYESGPPIATAKAVVDRYLDGLFDSRYEDFHVAASNDSWCDWFYDVVSLWDVTWVVTDLRNDRTTLVCVTDTD
jgi:hypothetical protein